MEDHSDDSLKVDFPATTLRGVVVDRLRSAIIAGRFDSGARLVERTLCDQLGVSRSVVREALRTLEAEGLVETIARVGPIVATLDWPRARQIYDIRRQLEASAASACAACAGADVQHRLRAALAVLQLAFQVGDAGRLLQATHDFYGVIFASAGHDIAWEIVTRLNGRISRLRALTLASRARSGAGHAHMQRICDAICAGDAQGAAAAVDDHLRDAAEIARQCLQGAP